MSFQIKSKVQTEKFLILEFEIDLALRFSHLKLRDSKDLQ